MSEWKPIETIPRRQIGEIGNNEVLMAWDDGVIRIGYCFGADHYCVGYDCGDSSASFYPPKDYLPTHWMPLPEPPEALDE